MTIQSPPLPSPCPDPLARAPRIASPSAHERLHRIPQGLQGAIAAIISRDIRGLGTTAEQRLTHFPASPLLSLSWFAGYEAGLVEHAGTGPLWRPFGASVVLAGSQSRPCTSWMPTDGRALMLCFTADIARRLFGVDPADIHDRFADARDVLDGQWRPLLNALLETQDDTEALAALERHLAPRWHAHSASALPSLRRIGRHWVERIALQAREWRRTHSPRQVERRVKAYSGRSLRQWQSLVKTEGVFFAARERYETGQPVDWAELAFDEGFADQAHLIRATRRITGFAPGEFARRFIEDESFWLYRLWV